MSSAANTAPRSARRILSGLELALALVGIPAALVFTAGAPHVPHLTALAQLRRLVTGPSGPMVDAVLHNLVWVVWALWTYVVVAFMIGLVARISAALGLSGPARRLGRIRNKVVPAALAALLDGVFTIALAVGPARAATSLRALPAPAVATLQPAPTPAQAPPAPGATYVVQRGDTLSGISAQAYGVPAAWPAIATANPAQVRDPNLIYPGEALAVPPAPATSTAATSAAPATYEVQHGDSLWSIAERFYGDGARSMDIFQLNQGQVVGQHGERLERPRFIEAGWTLRMPAGVPAPPVAPPNTAPAPVQPMPVSTPAMTLPVVPAPSAAATVPDAGGSPTAVASPAPTLTTSPTAGPVSPAAPPPASPSPSVSSSPGASVVGGTTSGVAVPPDAPGRAPRDGGRSWHIRLPGGAIIPWSLAGVLLAIVAVARARRSRDTRLSGRLTRVRPVAEGPQLAAIRRAGVVPSFDCLGPLARQVLEVGGAAGAFPGVVAAWECGDEVAFLLEGLDPEELPAPGDAEGILVRFEVEDAQVWAIASARPDVVGLRRGIWAAADGLLVPVGGLQDGALHLPLLGGPVCVCGPGASALVEAMLLQAAARSQPEDVRVVLVGDVDPFRAAEWPSGDWVLAPLQRVPLSEVPGLQATIEAQLMANTALVDQYGLTDVREQVWAHPDDRPVTTILVLDGALARQWGPLLIAGRQLGLAAIVLGDEDLPAARRLRIAEDGSLSVESPGVEPTDALVPCLLTADLAAELATAVAPEPTTAELALGEEASDAPPPPAPPVPDGVIRLHLLGGPLRVLDTAGNEVPQYGGRRATREVLAYLALHPDGVRKETLIEALWEADDFRDPTGELQTAISEARRWLVDAARESEGAKVPRGSGLQFIANKAGVYRLVTERVWVDVHAFERAVAVATAQPDDERLLRAAVEAYDGDLLPGADARDAFTWLEREGTRFELQKKVGWAGVHLAEVLRAACRPEEALAVLGPLLDSTLNDDVWLQAMLCEGEPPPHGHGARERVMQLWSRHQARLHQLDLEPTDRAQEVYSSLLSATEGRQRLTAVSGAHGGNTRKRRGDRDADAPDLRVLR